MSVRGWAGGSYKVVLKGHFLHPSLTYMGHFPQDGENEQNLSEQLRKLKKIKPFGHTEVSKKRTHFAHFPRPGENDPYMLSLQRTLILIEVHICNFLGSVGQGPLFQVNF